MNYDRCETCQAFMVATQDSAEFGMCPNGHGRIVKCNAVPQALYGKIEALMALPEAEEVGWKSRKKLFRVGCSTCTLAKEGVVRARRWKRGRWVVETFACQ
jgi:hypothetical protein